MATIPIPTEQPRNELSLLNQIAGGLQGVGNLFQGLQQVAGARRDAANLSSLQQALSGGQGGTQVTGSDRTTAILNAFLNARTDQQRSQLSTALQGSINAQNARTNAANAVISRRSSERKIPVFKINADGSRTERTVRESALQSILDKGFFQGKRVDADESTLARKRIEANPDITEFVKNQIDLLRGKTQPSEGNELEVDSQADLMAEVIIALGPTAAAIMRTQFNINLPPSDQQKLIESFRERGLDTQAAIDFFNTSIGKK